MQYHESIISQQAVATYVPLALWLAAWARRRGPPWEGDLRVEYERHPPRNAATSGLVPPAGEGAFLPLCQPSPVPRYSEHGYSGAKRICSFQLRRYLVVMHAWSTAQPSNVGPVVGPPRAHAAAAVGKRKRSSLLCLLAEARKREAFSPFRFSCFARQADGFFHATDGRPERSRPPSDYNTPPSRSSSEPFLTSLFSTTIRPSLSLSLSKARKLIPLSWDRRRIFLLFVSSLPFYLSSPVFVPPGPANRRLVSLAPISPRWSRRPPQKPVHASTVITSVGGRFRASRLLCECGLELQGGAMVNRNAEAGEPREAPAQQRGPAPALLDGDVIFAHRHLDAHLAHAAQGP